MSLDLRLLFDRPTNQTELTCDCNHDRKTQHPDGYVCLDCARIIKHTWYVDDTTYDINQPYEQVYYTASYKRQFHYSEKVKQIFGLPSVIDQTVLVAIAKKAIEKYGTRAKLTRKQVSSLCRDVGRNRYGLQYSFLRSYLDGVDYVPIKPTPEVFRELEKYFNLFDKYFDQIRSDLGRKNLLNYDFIIKKLLEKIDPTNLPKYSHVFKELKMPAKKEQLQHSWTALLKAFKADSANRHYKLFTDAQT